MNPTDRYRTLRSQGRHQDEALGELRRSGASPMDCIRAICEIEKVGFGEAKRRFATSSSWSDYVRANDESLIRELESLETQAPDPGKVDDAG